MMKGKFVFCIDIPIVEAALMSHPSMMYGSDAVPLPSVIPVDAFKPRNPTFPLIEIFACAMYVIRAGGFPSRAEGVMNMDVMKLEIIIDTIKITSILPSK